MTPRSAIAALVLLLAAAPQALALDAVGMIKERQGKAPRGSPGSCPLSLQMTGDAGNLHYYNLCSGYIWVFGGFLEGEGAGTRFEGSAVAPGNSIDRAVTYFRDVMPGYRQTVDVFLDSDSDGDGSPDTRLASSAGIDPGLRWNCWEVGNLCIPEGSRGVIVRFEHGGGTAPTAATDGGFRPRCEPFGTPHSFYYGIGAATALPWVGPTGRHDNFLIWLMVDRGCSAGRGAAAWDQLKALYR